jgi:hypothetical protein
MANITEILGTDSLSSSRITINGNFSSLNDELGDIASILDTTTATISGLSSITTESITVQNGGTLILLGNTNIVQVGVAAEFDAEVTLGGRYIKNGVSGSAATPINAITNPINPAAGEFTSYIVNSNVILPVGLEGQEITLINESSSAIVVAGTGNILGAQSLQLDGVNSTVTLRFIGSKWYIISQAGATFTL